MKSLLLIASALAATVPLYASATPPGIRGAHQWGETQRESTDQHGVPPQARNNPPGPDESGYGGMEAGQQTGRMSLSKSQHALYAHH
ncbi:hypothetical protein AK36_3936 [Burkholderia vietnamiensis LMG 10929]|nr:hypothetical protein AK36_3936 [Burkholderia vietnamiensis LMG 10929]